MAVEPTPSASVSTVTAVKPGERRSWRAPWRRSAKKVETMFSQPYARTSSRIIGLVAGLETRGAARVLRREAARAKIRGGAFQIVRDLVAHVAVGGAAPREHAQAAGELAPERHALSPPS